MPRLGQEVLIGFVGGDIDRLVVLGAVYNGQGNRQAAAAAGGTRPLHDWQPLLDY